MSEMNTTKDSRTVLREKLDGILLKDPTNALALAFKEALSDLSAVKAEQSLTLLNAELSGVKGTGADPSLEISKKVALNIECLKHPNYESRRSAARELREIKDPSAVPALCEALKDEYWQVRTEAADALGKIKDPRAVEPLIEAMKDKESSESRHVRPAAARALGEIKDPRAVPQLIEALKDEYSSLWQALESLCVRQVAARALGEIKDPRAVEPLIEALKGKGSDVGFFRWVADTADMFVYNDFLGINLLRKISFLRVDVRETAAGALQEIGDPKAIAPLRARLNGFLGIFGGERNSDVLDQIKRAIKTLE